MSSRPKPVAVFCASVPEDKAWLYKLETHLSVLQQQGLISLWHNQDIPPGTDWQREIDARLEAASIILLLVSADFLASGGREMTRALERHTANEARVIPILVRHSDWKGTPLARLRALPTDERPIATRHNEEQALAEVASAIRRIVAIEYDQQTVPGDSSLPQRWVVGGSSRLLLAIVGSGIFVFSAAVVWFLTQLSKIPQPWAGMLIVVLALLFGIGGPAFIANRHTFRSDRFRETQRPDSASTPPSPLSPPPQVTSFAIGQGIRLEIIEAPVRTEKAVSYQNVFLFNERLLDAKEFFGRKTERVTLLERSSKASSTSIVGPRRIGKTWLLEYLRYVIPDQLGSGYRVGYVNATMPRCDTISGFTRMPSRIMCKGEVVKEALQR